MNEIMKEGGKTQEELNNLQDMDYVKFYTSPARMRRYRKWALQQDWMYTSMTASC